MPGPEDRREPLDLGTFTPASDDDGAGSAASAPPEPGRSPSPWRLRAAIGVALAVGVAVGVVAANARDEAAQAQQVEIHPGPLSPLFSDAGPPTEGLDITLLNAGPHVIEIVDVTLPGWVRDEDADEPSAVTAEPGEWVTLTVPGRPRCEADRSGDVTVTARTESGDRTTSTLNLAEQYRNFLDSNRRFHCETLGGAGLSLRSPSAVTVTAPDTVTVTVPVVNGVDRPAHIIALASATPGFDVVSPDIPLVLSASESASMTLTWKLSDCTAAAQLEQPALTVDFKSGELQRRVEHNFDPTVLIELVRVSERSCRT